jgi:Uma2 family endonuclease
MSVVSPLQPIESRPGRGSIPPLEAGDHLDQRTFHERYERMGPGVRAELIGGEVHMPSPVGEVHSAEHLIIVGWLAIYQFATAGVRGHDNPTIILADNAEPQPDVALRIATGGRTRIVHRGETSYIAGPPELVIEVASSTESIDLHRKRHDYEQNDVGEYLAVLARTRAVIWFVREGGRFVELAPDADGVLRSRQFPGLWLDPDALLRGDTARVMEALNAGLASPEHAEFVASLAATSPPP